MRLRLTIPEARALADRPRIGAPLRAALLAAIAAPPIVLDVPAPEAIRAYCEVTGGQCATARRMGIQDRTVRRWCSGASAPRGAALDALVRGMQMFAVYAISPRHRAPA